MKIFLKQQKAEREKMHTDKKKNSRIILGIIACMFFSGGILFGSIWKCRQVKKLDCSDIPIQKEEKGVWFDVTDLSFDDNGVLYITARAENDKIQYKYKNWVLGEGKNVYRNMSMILIAEDGKTAYRLPTYPHAGASQSADQAEESTTNGIIAYAPRKILKNGPFSNAVL